MDYAIETERLTKKFKKVIAVRDLSLSVPVGSVFALLGPNGAGKTTTIKTVMNLLRPNSGRAKVLGIDSTKLCKAEFRQIGYVSEDQLMPDSMKVAAFLKYCRSMYPEWDDKFCSKLVERFDLPTNQRIKNLSRGMKMKAVLISSLAYRPKLLICDEPFSGLDPLVRDEFISGILDLTENENWTIFISSHDIAEVERLTDWVGIIDQGTLKISESLESLQARFKNITLTFSEPATLPPDPPPEWLQLKQDGKFVQFVDSGYRAGESEQKYRSFVPGVIDITATGMSLRKVFISLAREYRF
jgi:ABC-2 type transport system ATP-binding protein